MPTPPPNLSAEQQALLAQLMSAEGIGVAEPDAIPRHDGSARSRVSSAQERLWLIEQLDPGHPTYNVPLAYRLRGNLNIAALRKSFEILVERHESLRTQFTSGEEPQQWILDATEWDLPIVEATQETLFAQVEAEARAPFDLAHAPLFRLKLFRLDERNHVLAFTAHHILCDGWSLEVLFKELAVCYRALREGSTPQLEPLRVRYSDFANWEQERLRSDALGPQIEYWKSQLAGFPETLDLPADRPRPAALSQRGGRVSLGLQPTVMAQLRTLGSQENATLFMTLLAGFQAHLFLETSQCDLMVGTPAANRGREDLERVVGFFANTLVLRARLSGDMTFRQLLDQVRRSVFEAFAHQEVPFGKLVEILKPARDRSRNPLVQVVFGLHGNELASIDLPDIRCERINVETSTAKFDLMLIVQDDLDRPEASYEYSTDLFDEATIRRLVERFGGLLEAVAAAPDSPLADLPGFSGSTPGKQEIQRIPAPSRVADSARTEADSTNEPTLPVHHRLVTVWEDLLNIRSPGLDDSFFSIGGHSLLAAKLVARIREAFGRELSLAAVFTHPTIRKQAELLSDPSGAAQPRAIPIQTKGDAAPLFFLNVAREFAEEMAERLGPSQPTYLLVTPEPLHGPSDRTVEDEASTHVAAVRSVHPHGPYALAGYCAECWKALETAQQLASDGEHVAPLILIEPGQPQSRTLGATRRFWESLGPILRLSHETRVRGFMRTYSLVWKWQSWHQLRGFERWRRIRSRLGTFGKRDETLPERPGFTARDVHLERLWQRAGYSIHHPYAGRTALLMTEELLRNEPRTPAAWRKYLANSELHRLPGDHVTCLTVHRGALADILRKILGTPSRNSEGFRSEASDLVT